MYGHAVLVAGDGSGAVTVRDLSGGGRRYELLRVGVARSWVGDLAAAAQVGDPARAAVVRVSVPAAVGGVDEDGVIADLADLHGADPLRRRLDRRSDGRRVRESPAPR
ncbi:MULTISPECIES: hypothetical protein [unclassified Streptomyces]|uniref:hypothetical protein n=1 Tax=unclassified Streptomyces TaxID=2593676 RepID=UPI0013A69EC9|nr:MULTISPECIES: hypothetical protein [unclassified Streptomyces]QZZ25761.1 hypothetical protein A7X85_05385 [Streptomyces sp. ST1015]